MKRKERHHLKENEIERLTRQAREIVETRGREFTAIIVAAILIGGAALGYYGWRQRAQSQAHRMLAEAEAVQEAQVAQPATGEQPAQPGAYPNERARSEAAVAKLKAAADAYPSTDAGIYARYQQASTLLTLARPDEAIGCYNDVIQRAGNSIYAQMARLGIAEAHARAGRYDQAISVFKDLAQHKDAVLPVDGILMQLGRAYLEAGRVADAQETFDRVVEEFPDSPYAGEARQKLDQLKKT